MTTSTTVESSDYHYSTVEQATAEPIDNSMSDSKKSYVNIVFIVHTFILLIIMLQALININFGKSTY